MVIYLELLAFVVAPELVVFFAQELLVQALQVV